MDDGKVTSTNHGSYPAPTTEHLHRRNDINTDWKAEANNRHLTIGEEKRVQSYDRLYKVQIARRSPCSNPWICYPQDKIMRIVNSGYLSNWTQMSGRPNNLWSGRLKRSSFIREDRELQKKHQDIISSLIYNMNSVSSIRPWESKLVKSQLAPQYSVSKRSAWETVQRMGTEEYIRYPDG